LSYQRGSGKKVRKKGVVKTGGMEEKGPERRLKGRLFGKRGYCPANPDKKKTTTKVHILGKKKKKQRKE